MTDHQETLLEVLTTFARRLVSDYAVSDALHDLVDGATSTLQLAGAGVSLAHDGRLAFATATPEPLAALEQVQEDTQTGPCVEAYRDGQPVLVADVSEPPQRWPELTEAAARAGQTAVAGIPMHLNGSKIGVLNLYDDKRRDWTDHDIQLASLLADVATAYVANAQRLDQARETVAHLERALDTRVVIEQAKGMIAAHRDITVDAAFELLRNHARSHQTNLRSVAEGVVNLHLQL